VFQSLIRTAKGAGYHLYTDRFYTSYELAGQTRKFNIYLTGIVLGNRKRLPAEAIPLKMTVHEVKAY
jgi:hypothetical protein